MLRRDITLVRSLSTIVLLGVLTAWLPIEAQTPPAPSSRARYEVELKYVGLSGTLGSSGHACPGRHDGTDIITGIVAADESLSNPNDPQEDGLDYEGDLSRATYLSYCEMVDRGSGDKWCVPDLLGKQPKVRVTIKVYNRAVQYGGKKAGGAFDSARIEATPVKSLTDLVSVRGACTKEMESDIATSYYEMITVDMKTTQAKPIVDRLSVGSWPDLPVRPPSQPFGWTLTVKRKIQ